jgi:hypothetical protein
VIRTISGGFGGGGESSSARKAYERQLKDFEVYSVHKPPKSQRCETLEVRFSDDNYARVALPHTDALVVTLAIANYEIHRVLIDTRSLVDISYEDSQGQSCPGQIPLGGFFR